MRLVAGLAETLWDEALPIEVTELPEDLAELDSLLLLLRRGVVTILLLAAASGALAALVGASLLS